LIIYELCINKSGKSIFKLVEKMEKRKIRHMIFLNIRLKI